MLVTGTDLGQFTFADRARAADLIRYLADANALPDVRRCKRVALAALALRPGQAVLEVGCGYGADVAALARRVGPAGHAVGVDLSRAMIAEATRRSRRTGRGAAFGVADARRLPFADAVFDACRAERVLQHVPDPALAASELARVTRPGGRIAVIEFDLGGLLIDSPDRELTEAVVAEIDGGTVNGRAGRQLARLLAGAGLREVRARGELVQPGHAFLERIYQPALARLAGRDGRLAPHLEAWSERLRADAAADRFFAAAPVVIASATR